MELIGGFIVDLIWEGIFGSLGFGFLGYCIALTILFILRAKKILRRTKWYSKVFVVTYWIFIPIIFGCGFTAIKAIGYAKSTACNTADSAIDIFEEQTYPAFDKYINQNLEKYTGETILPTNEELVDKFFSDSAGNSGGNWITKGIMVWFLDIVEEQAEIKIADKAKMKKEEIHSIRLFKSGAVDGLFHGAFNKLKSVTHSWLNKFFMPYYFIVVAYWVVLLIFPIVETLIALRKRKRDHSNNGSTIADL